MEQKDYGGDMAFKRDLDSPGPPRKKPKVDDKQINSFENNDDKEDAENYEQKGELTQFKFL